MRAKVFFVMFAISLVISVFPRGAFSQDMESFFNSGNSEYEKGDYARAIAEYEKARLTGKVSAALYYNLAGAYLKSGDIGRAILNYQRATGLAPRDPDIASNYNFARSMVTGKMTPARGFFAWRPVRIYSRFFTVNEITIITSVLFFLFFVLLSVAASSENLKGKALFVSFFLAVAIFFNSAVIFHKVKLRSAYAVTVVPSSDALFAPFDSATKFFTLHEGNGVIILETKDTWCRVRRPDGMVGWVKSGAIERI